MAVTPNKDDLCIREVWRDNLDGEIALIRRIVDDFPFVAMDTEFPGTVLKPVVVSRGDPSYNYLSLKANVNTLKLIQLGLTFCDQEGSLPTCNTGKFCIWQFNFCEFSPLEDVCANESIDLLKRAGIEFDKFKEKGIPFVRFGEIFMSSGVVLNPSVHWITFHCAYDIGYLLRVLTSKKLPELEADFLNLVKIFFPILYDIKYMMKFHALHGSLTNLAIYLGVERLGGSHQAGSDSLLTSCVFREIKEKYCNGNTEQYAGVLYGLGVDSLSY